MVGSVWWWGLVAGVVHFVAIGVLYGNPVVDRVYARAADSSAAVRGWASRPRYLVTQFLGTQVEVYLLTIGFAWLRPMVSVPGSAGATVLGLLFAGLRVYPRFWNMWIQSTYPRNLLAIEFVNGVIGTLVVTTTLQLLADA